MEDAFQGVSEVEPTLARLKKYFATGKTKIIDWRKEQLKQIVKGLKELEGEFLEAYYKDHGRHAYVYKFQESIPQIAAAEHDLAYIDSWVKPIFE